MNSLDYIDSYFKGELPADETQQFEERISADPVFAEEVAFYVTAMQAVREESDERRRERFRTLSHEAKPKVVRLPVRSISYAAAAILVAVVALLFLFKQGPDPVQIADSYINSSLSTLGVSMGGENDAIQRGLQQYNQGNFTEASIIFQSVLKNDPRSFEALKYSGLSSLRLQQYDDAISQFERLAAWPGLYSNPGKFLQAITLLKRNSEQDKDRAVVLLKDVVSGELEGKADAQRILNDLK